jgi:hypothetical protein
MLTVMCNMCDMCDMCDVCDVFAVMRENSHGILEIMFGFLGLKMKALS